MFFFITVLLQISNIRIIPVGPQTKQSLYLTLAFYSGLILFGLLESILY